MARIPIRGRPARRFIRYSILLVLVFFIYYLWPAQQIESISKNLTVDQRNDYIDSILNPDNHNSIYHRAYKPVKAEFDPNKNINEDLEYPEIIDVDNVNEALNKMNLKPLDHKINVDDSTNILSDSILNLSYSPLPNLLSYFGNLNVNDDKLNYYNDLTCNDISYNAANDEDKIIQFSEPILLDDDLLELKMSLANNPAVTPVITAYTHEFNDLSNWFKTSGSSTWLPDEQAHLFVSSIMFSPQGDKNKPLISFIRLQLFDNNWNELKNRRIRYSGLNEKDIDKVLTVYAKTKEEQELDKISIKFPTVLNIPYEVHSSQYNLGAQNPKILFKDGEFRSEPVIIFSMLTSFSTSNMFAVFPFQLPKGANFYHSLIKFKNIGNNAYLKTKSDKNWVPFFDGLKIEDSKTLNGNIYFAYTLDPLVIFKCSLDTGKCKKLQDNIKYSKLTDSSKILLRGGTSLVPVPRQIVQSLGNHESFKRLQMWIGFSKLFINTNVCGTSMFRPVISLLIKEDGLFRLELISSPLDFDLRTVAKCEEENASIISPNGIAFWDISQNGEKSETNIQKFNDHLGLIIGESNSKVELIVLKNVLNYIFGIYERGNVMLGKYDLEIVTQHSLKVAECALEDAMKYVSKLGTSLSSQNSINKVVEE